MPSIVYRCTFCNYRTNHKAKFERHVLTLKHQIARDGIVCCGLIYHEKHKWVNHKKSSKHAKYIREETTSPPKPRIQLKLTQLKTQNEYTVDPGDVEKTRRYHPLVTKD